MKSDAIAFRRGFQTWSHVLGCDGDPRFEAMSCGEGFDHCCREVVAECSVPLLQLRHRPREMSQVKNLDLWGEGNELGAEPRLQFGRKSRNWRREPSGDTGICEGTAQPK